MAIVEEIIVPDVHMRCKDVYSALKGLITKDTDRVFLVGDLKNDINYSRIEELLPEGAKRLTSDLIETAKGLESIIKSEYGGSSQELIRSLQDGSAPPSVKDAFERHASILKELSDVEDGVFAKESYEDYRVHEEWLSAIRKEYGVSIYGVPGNHDTSFLSSQVESVDWLIPGQSLREEGIIGAFGCHPENGGEVNPAFNGPNLKYAPPIDDSLSLDESPVYDSFKDSDVDLIVTHSGPDIGPLRESKNGKIPAMAGLTALVKEKGPVVYEGHMHGGIVYKCPDSGAHIIRPGVNHIARVKRDGNKLLRVELYKI
ncbi:hypothetical protein D6825_02325 [Candidatus Woesearchaeota archaeon]|nr:MAG: hypothetical protein D6825_02325 [Candidatus Woesearchaeota archaeon]